MGLTDRDLLARLVAFDTTSHRSNLPFVDFLADYLDGPGIRLTRYPSPDERKAALLAELGPDPDADRAGLLLCGHSDVVPAGDGWRSDPFTLAERDGRLVGRGACDMKGFLAVAANRVLAAAAAGRAPRRRLALLVTYDEEVGMVGARRLTERLEAERLPRAAMIGEPTRLRVARAHKGIVELRVTLTGRSAHSGYPHLGRSAIEPAARVAVALAALREQLAQERPAGHELFPDVPFVSLNVGTIRGGTAPNVVADRCELGVTVRPLPGGDARTVLDRIERAVRAAAGDSPVDLTLAAEGPPMETAADAPVLRALAEATDSRETEAVSYATDAGWLQRLGLDCAICGPGDVAVAHRPDEYLDAAELERAGRVVERVMGALCA